MIQQIILMIMFVGGDRSDGKVGDNDGMKWNVQYFTIPFSHVVLYRLQIFFASHSSYYIQKNSA